MMLHSRSSSVFAIALLFTLFTAPKPTEAAFTDPILAQSPVSTSPASDAIPSGTGVRIDGSNSMMRVNQTLKQQLQGQGTAIEDKYNGTRAALEALQAGNIDLAAIGRPLTSAEKAQGLTEVPLGFQKIAIVVGANNPFTGDLTFEQFAQLFRGEITDWAAIGGAAGAIRFIDHPVESDTRQAFSRYPVFQAAPFENGANTVRLSQDSGEAVAAALGTNGIGYIIADQTANLSGVRIVSMHDTLPTDPRYPFSQPLFYVYKGDPSPVVASFLQGINTPAGQQALAAIGVTALAQAGSATPQAVSQAVPSSPAVPSEPGAIVPSAISPTATSPTATSPTATSPAATSPAATSPAATSSPLSSSGASPAAITPSTSTPAPTSSTLANDNRTGFPVWLWWLLPLLGIPLLAWLLLKGRRPAETADPPAATPATTPAIDPTSSASSEPTLAERTGTVISADRNSITNTPTNTSTNTPTNTPILVEEPTPSITPIGVPDSGVLSGDVPNAEVPATEAVPPEEPEASTGMMRTVAGIAASAAGVAASGERPPDRISRITLTPRNAGQAYAQWEVPEENKATLRQQGGTQYTLRLCDVTGLNFDTSHPHRIFQSLCQETDQDRNIPIPQADRDYVAEIGYLTKDNRWLLLARSNPVHIAAPVVEAAETRAGTEVEPTPADGTGAIAAGTGLAAGIAAIADNNAEQEAIEATKFNVGQTDLRGEALADVDAGLPDLPAGYAESQIVLLPRDPNWAYAYWDIPNDQRAAVRQQGGSRLALRFYDVTDINLESQNPHGLQQYDCDELARDWYIPVPVSDRDYIVEIGYLTLEGKWLMLARSNPAHIPPVYASDWLEEQFVTVDWNEALQHKTVHELVPQERRTRYNNPIYDKIFGIAGAAEVQRVAGSLFGSMHQVPEKAISSHIFPSGVSGAVPTTSGIGMSGVGMSGVGMSGIGMSGVGMSGVGMSGIGMYSMSGIGASGIGMYSMSGITGMSGIGMYSMSGAGMISGAGIYSMSGITGMSGIGLYSMSGVGMSGISGMYSASGVGMSGIGMYSMSGAGIYNMSGAGIYSMSGVGMSGIGFSASAPPIRPRKFWLVADAELVVHGATEPDATVMIGDRTIKLNPDGTFRFQVAFPDGDIRYPVLAIAADGEQTRSIRMEFNRETPVRYTNTKDEAVEEWLI